MTGTQYETCAVDACTRRKASKGWCESHYQRVRRHGDPMAHVPIGATGRVKGYGIPLPECTVDGCDRAARTTGADFCAMHYQRANKRGDAGVAETEHGSGLSLRDRVLRFTRILPTGCVEWTARRNAKGYGQVHYPGTRIAHRAVYELLVGPIPKGMTLDHLCLNTWCVAPAHLEPVTASENSLRAWRVRRGEAI